MDAEEIGAEPCLMRTVRQRISLIIAVLGSAAPFGIAFIRYKETGSDLRYLWMAVTTMLATGLTIAIAKPRTPTSETVWRLSAIVFVVATLVAAATGYILGTRSGVGLSMVATAFGLSWAATHAFFIRSHPTSRH